MIFIYDVALLYVHRHIYKAFHYKALEMIAMYMNTYDITRINVSQKHKQ